MSLTPEERAEIEELRASLHYANGVADLAMLHRDAAEAEVERLREALARIRGARPDRLDHAEDVRRLERCASLAGEALQPAQPETKETPQ